MPKRTPQNGWSATRGGNISPTRSWPRGAPMRCDRGQADKKIAGPKPRGVARSAPSADAGVGCLGHADVEAGIGRVRRLGLAVLDIREKIHRYSVVRRQSRHELPPAGPRPLSRRRVFLVYGHVRRFLRRGQARFRLLCAARGMI